MARKAHLGAAWFICLLAATAAAQAPAKPKPPTWLWGLDLKARTGGTDDFDKARKFGVEVFKDENSGQLVYICETGSFAAVPGAKAAPAAKPKTPTWLWGLDLKARTGGTDDFDKARKFGVEVYKDENAGNLVYICETGTIAVVPAGNVGAAAKPKPPTWVWALDLKARTGGTDDFAKARKFGIEVFKDENSGQLVYICETGAIGVRPAGNLGPAAKPKAPTWMWGLDLKARTGGTDDFEKARKFGIEVFKDENAGNLIYMNETGSFALLAGGNLGPAAKPEAADLDVGPRPQSPHRWHRRFRESPQVRRRGLQGRKRPEPGVHW